MPDIRSFTGPPASGDNTPLSKNDAFEAFQALAAGRNVLANVVAASTANINLSSALINASVMDGVTLATGNRVLIKNQTTASQNGIYIVAASGAASRATDADSQEDLKGACVYVVGGTTNGFKEFAQITAGTITVGTTALQFVETIDHESIATTALQPLVDEAEAAATSALNAIALVPTAETVRVLRDRVATFWDAFIDTDKKLFCGLDSLGRYNVVTLKIKRKQLDRDRHFGGGQWFIDDSNSHGILGINKRGALLVGSSKIPARDRHVGKVSYAFESHDGKGLLGFNQHGRAAGAAMYIPASEPSADYNYMNVRDGGDSYYAIVQESDGTVSEVRQRKGFNETAVVQSRLNINGSFWYGQSNSETSGSSTALVTDAIFPHHCLQFTSLKGCDAASRVPQAVELTGLSPAQDSSSEASWPATLGSFAIERLLRDSGTYTAGRIVFTSAKGGNPISSFIKGTDPYNTFINAVTAAKREALRYGRTFELNHIVWVQGESGPYNYATYSAALTTLIDDLQDDVEAITGQRPLFVIVGTNANDLVGAPGLPDGVRDAQVDVANTLYGSNVIYAGSMYHAPIGEDDGIHATALGRLVTADMVGRAIKKGSTFRGLRVDTAVRTGATIVVNFLVPSDGGNIAFDPGPSSGGWVKPIEDHGFTYYDTGATAYITAVNITGAAQVTITLNTTPNGGSKALLYAMGPDPVTSNDGWSGGRGALMSLTTTPSVFYHLGYSVPSTINYYCNPFSYSLT
jgi:hypothetical protein